MVTCLLVAVTPEPPPHRWAEVRKPSSDTRRFVTIQPNESKWEHAVVELTACNDLTMRPRRLFCMRVRLLYRLGCNL